MGIGCNCRRRAASLRLPHARSNQDSATREEIMTNDRREFMKLAGATTAAATAIATSPATAQQATPGQFRGIKALAFDAYGTLFDVFSVISLCEQLFPGKGNQVAQI